LNTSLPSIVAYARSGALEHAWRLFRAGGYEAVTDDPAVLSVRGRLLKDSARAAAGPARRAFYRQAAEAYARAGRLGGAAYPLINAATLSLLAGQPQKSRALAKRVLARGDDPDETPYYRAATRAEALLLLGDLTAAKDGLAKALAAAPRAYEDHASTLRQFALILAERKADAAWLDAYRPPRVLHFAGHMGVAPDGGGIAKRIRDIVRDENVGFGYGALAAGADIVVAEALIEAGAELHLILPLLPDAFRAQSVARFGRSWASRFDRLVERAESIRATGSASEPLTSLSIRLAAEVAMGRAAMQAETLATEAIQLLVADRKPAAGRASGGSGAIWARGGRRTYVLAAPRARRAEATGIGSGNGHGILAAMLRIEPDSPDALAPLRRSLAKGDKPRIAPRWSGEAVAAAYDTAAAAARAALAAASRLAGGGRIAAHYSVVHAKSDPFGGGRWLSGAAAGIAAQILPSTPPGAIYVTEDFAAALRAAAPEGAFRVEYVGELDAPGGAMPLYALKR